MKKLNNYLIIVYCMIIQVSFLQGMFVTPMRKYYTPIVRRGFSKDTAYVYYKSQDAQKPKLSKLVEISPTLPRTWFQRLLNISASPNPEYYALIKDYEAHKEFREKHRLVPTIDEKSESNIVVTGFTKDGFPIYQIIKTSPNEVSINR